MEKLIRNVIGGAESVRVVIGVVRVTWCEGDMVDRNCLIVGSQNCLVIGVR